MAFDPSNRMNRYWYAVMKITACTAAVAYLSGVAFNYYSRSPYSEFHPWRDAWIGVVAYFVVAALLSIVNFFGGLLYLMTDKGSDLEEDFLAQLRLSRLPPPNEWQPSNADYLERMADDTEEKPENRVKAAVIFGMKTATQQHLGFIKGIAYAAAADRAVLRYAAEAPKVQR